MAGFSASLKLTGLDYIAPSQACVLPLQGGDGKAEDGSVLLHPRQKKAAALGPNGAPQTKEDKIKLELADCLACSGCVTTAETMLVQEQSLFKFYQILEASGRWGFPAPPPKAPFDQDEANAAEAAAAGVGGAAVQAYKKLVVSVSPQSLASFATRLGVPPSAAWAKLVALFRTKLGCDAVFDLVWAQDVTLVETLAEMTEKFAAVRKARAPAAGGATAAAVAPIAKRPKRAPMALGGDEAPSPAPATEGVSSLPLITSACPGLVCYVEKTERKLLPHLSTARSSQSMFGTLLKKACVGRWRGEEGWGGVGEGDVCHITIQPCYDRKLEASRREFQWEAGAEYPGPAGDEAESGRAAVKATDLVLATHELFELLDAVAAADGAAGEEGGDATGAAGVAYLMNLPDHPQPWSSNFGGRLLRDAYGLAPSPQAAGGAPPAVPQFFLEGSGGFCPIVVREVGKMYGVDVTLADFDDASCPAPHDRPYHLRVSSKRANFTEYELFVKGVSVFTAATCYGFQNIRNLARATRVRAAPYANYDFIELMACPDGCVNGGGQIRTTHYPATPAAPAPTNRQLIEKVKESYAAHVDDVAAVLAAADGGETLQLDAVHGVVGGAPYSERARLWLHTTFNDLGKAEAIGTAAPSLASMTW